MEKAALMGSEAIHERNLDGHSQIAESCWRGIDNNEETFPFPKFYALVYSVCLYTREVIENHF